MYLFRIIRSWLNADYRALLDENRALRDKYEYNRKKLHSANRRMNGLKSIIRKLREEIRNGGL
jgi:DNA repair ATPase RecN